MSSEKDTIYRQDAIDLVRDVCNAIMSGCSSHYDEETGDEVFDDILEVDAILKCNKELRIALKHMPSAQPEIIRCKNCAKLNNMGYCTKFQNNIHGIATSWYMPDDDDFCSYAERRTDEP
jgi:hypothetical protein